MIKCERTERRESGRVFRIVKGFTCWAERRTTRDQRRIIRNVGRRTGKI